MNKVANYDTLDYDYSTYWKNREYENQAEKLVLNKLLKGSKGSWFVDIGGSFGRLTCTYYDKYSNPVIVDYSLKTLQKNYQYLKDTYPNVQLIAANAYHLPFVTGSFDGGLMVRVLHHIDTPQKYFKELGRILKPDGIYIQEFANKVHLKAVIKSLLRFDFTFLSKKPYQQPKKNHNEGARKEVTVPFFNYHPSWIKEQLEKESFKVLSVYGCSFLRSNTLKKLLGTNLLINIESILQKFFSWTYISPSIFIKSIYTKEQQNLMSKDIYSILVCPKCNSTLKFTSNMAKCSSCKKEYTKKENIWDFRI